MLGIHRQLARVTLTLALVLTLRPVLAQPSLSLIQDVIFKADATPFNGVALVTWTGFTAGDGTIIAPQGIAVQIVNGVIQVRLVPSTNASLGASYSVVYNSDGKYQFSETWAVPPSTTPLHLSDVRIASSGGSGGQTGSQIQISDVANLSNELALRPVKGAGYTASRAAVIDATGGVTAAVGSLSDCVRVDGSSGPCGSGGGGGSIGPSFVDAEIPGGTINGVNSVFTLANPPNPGSSLLLYRNGVLMKPGLDFTLASGTVTFLTASLPQIGDVLLASYRLAGVGGAPAPQVLCSATGQTSSAAILTSLGSCTVAANLLQPGDRVEIRADYAHSGTSSGFTAEVHWGNTLLAGRAAATTEPMVTLQSSAGVYSGSTQWSATSWGTTLIFAATAGNAPDSLAAPLTIGFFGQMASATTETVTLRNLTVLRYPAH